MPSTAVTPLELARRSLGWSQVDLAEHSGVSREAISWMERGRPPRLRPASRLAATLGVEVADVLPAFDEAPAANRGSVRTSTAGPGRPNRVRAA